LKSNRRNDRISHGYSVFSAGPADLAALLAYIDNQDEHHQMWIFNDEYRRFLKQHAVAFDECYVRD